MTERWDRHFLALAATHARMSKDTSTKVGTILVRDERLILAAGFNGFPYGIADDDRLLDRELKLKLIVHAEMNAVLAAARRGISVDGATMYTACQSGTERWGGPPCTRCAVECIQAGIREVVSYPAKLTPSRWAHDLLLARSILAEAGVKFRELPLDPA